jgi:hypothetical protein
LILCTLRGLVGHQNLVAGFTGKYDKNLTNVTPTKNFFGTKQRSFKEENRQI